MPKFDPVSQQVEQERLESPVKTETQDNDIKMIDTTTKDNSEPSTAVKAQDDDEDEIPKLVPQGTTKEDLEEAERAENDKSAGGSSTMLYVGLLTVAVAGVGAALFLMRKNKK